MVQYFQKPENALKRAQEFIDIGKPEAALDVLYEVIKSKKHRNWQKIHEPILQMYLKLCVNLKRSVNAKEGLYQYKLICQQMNILSLEETITFFLNIAEKHADEAKNQSIELVTVEDLDQLQTPEGILLSSVSSEDAQDRSDRVLLTPWVKFLWEAYRNVLELLRNNNRVEKLYHETAQNAFKFCLKYMRRAEFRKLCLLIKNHLDQVLKYQGQPTAINLNSPESLQMHLETRLVQLENAITMELWQEAFRAIEGIHYLMLMSKKPPKPHMMANYYQKVALVFLKADNYLFHSASLFRLFTLVKEQKKTVTPEELEKIGSQVLLATLSIPIPPGKSSMEEYLSYDTQAYEKDRRLATLLSLLSVPTRKSLIEDVEAIIFPHVSAPLKELFATLELKFEPLKICKKVNETLQIINKDENLLQYSESIKEIAITRLLSQISQVYEKISFKQLLKMVPFADRHQLEHRIVNCVKENDMQIYINHQKDSISFGSALMVALREEVPNGPHIQGMPSEILRSQLFVLSEGLKKSICLVNPEAIQKEHDLQREQLVAQYLRQERKEHVQLLYRKAIIEQRKERIENERNAQEKYEREQANLQKELLRQAEEQRLEIEREKRERERRAQEMKEIQKQQVWDRVESLRGTEVGKRAFKNLSAQEIDEMDPADILQRQYDQVNREKREQQSKLRTQEKRIDHLVRAMRLEEIPILEKHIAEQKIKDRKEWEKDEEERLQNAAKEHQLALQTKSRLERMSADKQVFLDTIFGHRHKQHEVRLREFEMNLKQVRNERLEANKKQRMAQRRQEFILARREEKRKEKAEQLRREKEAEEIRKQKEAEEKRILQEARLKALEESARKQKEKEREIEEKLEKERNLLKEEPKKETVVAGKYIPPSQRRRMETAAGVDNWRGAGGDEVKQPVRPADSRDDSQRFGKRDESRGYDRRDDARGFDKRDDTRGFDKRDDLRSYEKRDDPRGYDRRDDSHGYDKRDDSRGYDKRDDPRGFDKRDDPRGYDKRDDSRNFNRKDDTLDRRDGRDDHTERRSDDKSDSYRGFSGNRQTWRGEGGGDSWRSGDKGNRPEGRSYKMSRVGADRDRDDSEDRPKGSGTSSEDGWNVVRR
ncbi:eukaryotic translation initiation factor 3 subunit A isoform X1 [Hydra vulgaris]|uniref:eukaryotic translation initiation factor 3 subunit A isoform X1 n=1 Tax=Hydra vulgaris TaxID=6087 RepID=UPI001F5EEE7A|nr:eukaryotic translation initiation factor 3 subunit A isoform X1 [Hydra vulgaris]